MADKAPIMQGRRDCMVSEVGNPGLMECALPFGAFITLTTMLPGNKIDT